MKELTLEATVDNLPQVMSFLEEELEAAGCPMKTQMQISVSVEEIYVNIASYAYAPGTGEATVRVEFRDDPAAVCITFIDAAPRKVNVAIAENENPRLHPHSEYSRFGCGVNFLLNECSFHLYCFNNHCPDLLKLSSKSKQRFNGHLLHSV